MINITFKRVSVSMGDDAGNGEYNIEMPADATAGDLLNVLLYGGCGNGRPIPYTGANRWWVINSNVGVLAYIYTDAGGEWHIKPVKCEQNTPLEDLGIKWVFGGRPDEKETKALMSAEPAHMKVQYSMDTPAGSFSASANREPLRCRSEIIGTPDADGAEAYLLSFLIPEYRSGDIVFTARMDGGRFTPAPDGNHTKILIMERDNTTCALGTYDFSGDSSVRVPYRVSRVLCDGFEITVPEKLKKYSKIANEFCLRVIVAWTKGCGPVEREAVMEVFR